MNVLSKEWFAITASFPILDFDLRVFSRDVNASPRSDHVKNMFFEYVMSTTFRFCRKSTNAHTFKLRGLLVDTPSKLSIVGRLSRFIATRGVLQKLQEVELDFRVKVERIDIDAPNLFLELPNLEGSADFLSNFPYVENLYLDTLHPNLKLSSHSLKTLVLHPCCDLDVTEIDAPNLVLLEYSRTNTLPQLLVRNSAKSEAQMEIFPTGEVNALWFNKLRRFLSKTTGFLKVLKLNLCSSTFIDVEELKAIDSPSFELQRVEVALGSIKEFTVYVAAVDAILWCLRPRYLTIKSDFHFLDLEYRCRVVTFAYQKLLQQKDEGRTHIQIEFSISSSKAKRHFNDLNSLLAALPRDPLRHIITLVKEDSDAVKEA